MLIVICNIILWYNERKRIKIPITTNNNTNSTTNTELAVLLNKRDDDDKKENVFITNSVFT